MNKSKFAFLIVTILIFLTIFAPITAYAVAEYEVTTSVTPNPIATMGGDVELKITFKNTGSEVYTRIHMELDKPSSVDVFDYMDVIGLNSSKTYTNTVTFEPGDLDTNINLTVWAEHGGGWLTKVYTVNVNSEENVIRSDSEIIPEQDVYYVGETVSVTDTMRNSLGINVTGLEMEYYLRRDSGTSTGDTVNIGTVTPNERVSNTLEYTFSEADIGELRIGSKVTYYVSGRGAYTEYNVAHDFVVEPSPTPTASPTPTPEPTPTASPEPVQTEEMIDTTPVSSVNNGTDDEIEQNTDESENERSILSDRSIVITLIIAAGAIVALIIVLLIVLASKKGK